MIYLKKEKELQRIDDDCKSIPNIPGWTGKLTKKYKGFIDIIGYYKNCKDKIQCGLRDCHSWHKNGFLLSTKTGEFTHIGRNCGNNITGVDFNALCSEMEKAVDEFETRELLYSRKNQVPTFRNNCQTLKVAAAPIRRRIQALKHPQTGLPETARQAISKMNTSRNGAILVERKLSDSEYQAAKQTQGGKGREVSRFITEVAGYLAGYTAWDGIETLRRLIASEIPAILDELERAYPEQLSPKELKSLAKASGELAKQFNTAKKILTECKLFLSPNNLLLLLSLVPDSKEDQNRIVTHAHGN